MRLEIPFTYGIEWRPKGRRNKETGRNTTSALFDVPEMDQSDLRPVALLSSHPERPDEPYGDGDFGHIGGRPVRVAEHGQAFWREAVRIEDLPAIAAAGVGHPAYPFAINSPVGVLCIRYEPDVPTRTQRDMEKEGRTQFAELNDDGGEAAAERLRRMVASDLRVVGDRLYVRTSEPCIDVVPGGHGERGAWLSLSQTDRNFARWSYDGRDYGYSHLRPYSSPTGGIERYRLDRLEDAIRAGTSTDGTPPRIGFDILELDPARLRFSDDAWTLQRAVHQAEHDLQPHLARLDARTAAAWFAVRDERRDALGRPTPGLFDAARVLVEGLMGGAAGIERCRLRDIGGETVWEPRILPFEVWRNDSARMDYLPAALARWQARPPSGTEWVSRGNRTSAVRTGFGTVGELLTLDDAGKIAWELGCSEIMECARNAADGEGRLFASFSASGSPRTAAWRIGPDEHPAHVERIGGGLRGAEGFREDVEAMDELAAAPAQEAVADAAIASIS